MIFGDVHKLSHCIKTKTLTEQDIQEVQVEINKGTQSLLQENMPSTVMVFENPKLSPLIFRNDLDAYSILVLN